MLCSTNITQPNMGPGDQRTCVSKNCHSYGNLHIYYTVNVDIFALSIFSRNSRFLGMCENMYPSKITFIYRASCT